MTNRRRDQGETMKEFKWPAAPCCGKRVSVEHPDYREHPYAGGYCPHCGTRIVWSIPLTGPRAGKIEWRLVRRGE
jgi:rRNA maturation protein Nop10